MTIYRFFTKDGRCAIDVIRNPSKGSQALAIMEYVVDDAVMRNTSVVTKADGTDMSYAEMKAMAKEFIFDKVYGERHKPIDYSQFGDRRWKFQDIGHPTQVKTESFGVN